MRACTCGAFQSGMRLQIEIPAFLHGDASVYYCAVAGVAAMCHICMMGTCRIETCVMTLANDDDGDFGRLEVPSLI